MENRSDVIKACLDDVVSRDKLREDTVDDFDHTGNPVRGKSGQGN